MRARALLIETLVGITSAAVAAGAFCWMVKYTVLKEADMIVIAAAALPYAYANATAEAPEIRT